MIFILVMHQDYGPYISPATHQRIIQVSWDVFIKLTTGWNIFHELPHPTLSFNPIMSSVMSPFPSPSIYCRDGVREAEMKLAPQLSLAGLHRCGYLKLYRSVMNT